MSEIVIFEEQTQQVEVRLEGKRRVARAIDHYELDVIISVGYRVKSQSGVRFRQWATRVLREHLPQGCSLNEHRLAQQGQAPDGASGDEPGRGGCRRRPRRDDAGAGLKGCIDWP